MKKEEKELRELLESYAPDKDGQWPPPQRIEILQYVWQRDKGRCGLCSANAPLDKLHVEHIVPKCFYSFNVNSKGIAEHGIHYRSKVHKLDNLQAAHPYCNKAKRNTTSVKRWRHPVMRSLKVADNTGFGFALRLPWTKL